MPFNAARVMGVAPQPYDSYFDGGEDGYQSPYQVQSNSPAMIGQPDDPTGSFTLSGVQSQPFANPMALGSFDPIQNQIENQKANAAAAQRQAEGAILSGNTDWSSDEGRQKLQDYVARGAVSPQQARAMIYTIPKEPKLNRYSAVPVEVAQGLNKLAQVDPTDPDAWSNLQSTIAPNSIPVDVQSHPQFQSDLKEMKREILNHRTQQIALGRHDPDDDLISKAQAEGVTGEELQPYLDENGKVADKIGLRNAAYQAKANKSILGGEPGKKLADLLYGASAVAPTDEEKQDWLARNPTANGPDKFTQAWNGVRQEKLQNYQSYLSALQAAGYKRLPTARDQQNVPQGTIPQSTEQIPAFNTQEEAEASGVPAGTIVTIGGRRFRKD